MPYVAQVLQSLVVLTFAPLYAGVIARAEAVVGSKRGPSVLQPYRDLAKLLRKGSASSRWMWIPGCPPSPLALLHGLLVAVNRLAEKSAAWTFIADAPAEEVHQ